MSEERNPETDQALPAASTKSKSVADFLKSLIDKRTELGIKKYGMPLMSHNGRDPIRDALEESLDLNQYLAQCLMEARDELDSVNDTLAVACREASVMDDKDVMAIVDGKAFRCECGCNVFRNPVGKPSVYHCNSCGDMYAGEK